MGAIIKSLMDAIKRDKSYVIGGFITAFVLILMFSEHDWQSRPLESSQPGIKSDIPDFANITDVKQKKAAFFAYLTPMVLKENDRIKYKQILLDKLINDLKNESFHARTTNRKLAKLAKEFGLPASHIEDNLDELKSRIDLIPVSLVLAQAANESAWGTSRFARQANNLFGQWCYEKGCGLVPTSRGRGQYHEVRKYRSVQESIASYMRNLNSHNAYKDLRNLRAGLKRRGQRVTGVKLAQGLEKYSERGQDYVDEITAMIKHNRLE